MRLVFIFQLILGFQSQRIYFKYSFSWDYIIKGGQVFIEIPRYLKSDGGEYDVIIILKKILYGQDKATRLWYEKLIFC